MFYAFAETAGLITVDDAFATLDAVLPNGDLRFLLTYSVDPGQVISRGASSVSVSAVSRYVAPKPLLGSTTRGMVDAASLVDNIRSLLPDAKTALQQRTTYVIASTVSDIMAYVNTEVVRQLAAGVPPGSIQQLRGTSMRLVPASRLKQAGDPKPILQTVINTPLVGSVSTQLSASFAVDAQALMREMVMRQGMDPGQVSGLNDRSQSALMSRQGLLNPSRAIELLTDPATQLANFHVFPSNGSLPPSTTDDVLDSELVHVLDSTVNSTVEITVPLVLSASRMQLEGADLTSVFVQFELVDPSTNEPIDVVTKTLNVSRELQVYNTPKLPPIVKLTTVPGRSRASLQVRQRDATATAVKLYRKPVYVASADVEDYSLVGTYQLMAGQQVLQVKIDMPQTSPVIYRAIAVGQHDTVGSDYTNVVVKPGRYTPLKSIALTATQVDQGLQLEVRNLPSNCVAIQFLRWNLTTFDSTYSIVNGNVAFIDASTRMSDLITIIDTDVFPNNIYRYVGRLVYSDGLTQDSGDATIEFLKPAPGQVSTTIAALLVSHTDSPDVTFNINTSTNDTDMDVVKRMLEAQGQAALFQGSLQDQRNQLADLIAWDVQRVDLKTGVREDFGTISDPTFTDSLRRKNRAVSPLQYGHSYRYEVYPLLRSAETLMSSIVNPAVDPTTKKAYSYNPSKYFHPVMLTRGVLVSQAGAAQLYSKDPMSFGILGNVTTVVVSFDADTATVTNQSATRFNRSLNVVSWQLRGDINQVDHFLIMTQVNGIRKIVGKAHSEFAYGSCQFLHPVTAADNGSIGYVISPVMNDYKVGPEALTNTVVVDAP